jgi:hypothetical protein
MKAYIKRVREFRGVAGLDGFGILVEIEGITYLTTWLPAYPYIRQMLKENTYYRNGSPILDPLTGYFEDRGFKLYQLIK